MYSLRPGARSSDQSHSRHDPPHQTEFVDRILFERTYSIRDYINLRLGPMGEKVGVRMRVRVRKRKREREGKKQEVREGIIYI